MKKLILVAFMTALLMACAKDESTVLKTVQVTQNCTVYSTDGNAVISCPDGTEITLPPTVIIETVEVPVLVKCHHDHGNHNGHDKHD